MLSDRFNSHYDDCQYYLFPIPDFMAVPVFYTSYTHISMTTPKWLIINTESI